MPTNDRYSDEDALAETIRQIFLRTYPNPDTLASVGVEIRFSAGAADAAHTILAHGLPPIPGSTQEQVYRWQEDLAPTTESPQEATENTESVGSQRFSGAEIIDRYRERTAGADAIPFQQPYGDWEQRIQRAERIINDNARDAERRLSDLETQAAHDRDATSRVAAILEQRTQTLTAHRDLIDAIHDRLGDHDEHLTATTAAVASLNTWTSNHAQSAYPHRSARYDTRAPDDDDARLGGHDNPHPAGTQSDDDDHQAHA